MNSASVAGDLNPQKLLDGLLRGPLRSMGPLEQAIFRIRFDLHLPDVVRPLNALYGGRADFIAQLANLLAIAARAYAARPEELRLLDLRRAGEPDWFQQPGMVGYVCYVDRFAGDLIGVKARIPYLKELGIDV